MTIDERKRRINEQKFGSWKELPDGGRRYWHEVAGRRGWTARYLKEVDADENTVRFWQEIYNEQGVAVERHIKYPVDAGHERLEE
jgi:hypothetical protein